MAEAGGTSVQTSSILSLPSNYPTPLQPPTVTSTGFEFIYFRLASNMIMTDAVKIMQGYDIFHMVIKFCITFTLNIYSGVPIIGCACLHSVTYGYELMIDGEGLHILLSLFCKFSNISSKFNIDFSCVEMLISFPWKQSHVIMVVILMPTFSIMSQVKNFHCS